ncbi:MAG: TerC family protein [Chloroflexi bacterium]|nr:TerC family protein [Chloroflexota bacterium]
MFEWIMDPNIWASLVTLCVLEIVLGIDNIIFLSIITSALPRDKQNFARVVGLSLALVLRVLLLSCIVWLEHLDKPFLHLFDHAFSVRDIILVCGGLFLLYKSTAEIHQDVEGGTEGPTEPKSNQMAMVVVQIAVIDIVFSLDSIFTAVGVADHLPVMIAAIVVAIMIMMFAAKPVGNFVEEHPTVKMLALSFLLLVGMMLIADAFGLHIPRGYLYFAICFSLGVETLNQLAAKKRREKQQNT